MINPHGEDMRIVNRRQYADSGNEMGQETKPIAVTKKQLEAGRMRRAIERYEEDKLLRQLDADCGLPFDEVG